jgi:transposase
MGRTRTQLMLSAVQQAELPQRLRAATDPRERERLQVALWASSGRHTLEVLAEMAGRSRATIQTWLDKFKAGGLPGLLERDTPPGSTSPLSRSRLQAQLKTGLASGRWSSAQVMATWLKETYSIQRARKSLYYWLKKHGWPAPGARNRPLASAHQERVLRRRGVDRRPHSCNGHPS